MGSPIFQGGLQFFEGGVSNFSGKIFRGSPIFRVGGLQFFGWGVSNFSGGLQFFGGVSNFLGGLQKKFFFQIFFLFFSNFFSQNFFWDAHPRPPPETVNVRFVCILLECILVQTYT